MAFKRSAVRPRLAPPTPFRESEKADPQEKTSVAQQAIALENVERAQCR